MRPFQPEKQPQDTLTCRNHGVNGLVFPTFGDKLNRFAAVASLPDLVNFLQTHPDGFPGAQTWPLNSYLLLP